MKNVKNNLDEMQEAKLLQIEHNGCWLAFWGLLAAMIVELFVFGVENMRYFIGEWIVFMLLSLYLSIACMKNSIWDRRLKADPMTNLTISLIAAAVSAVIMAVVSFVRYHSVNGALSMFVIFLVVIFAVCYASLSLGALFYKKKLAKLESESDEDEA